MRPALQPCLELVDRQTSVGDDLAQQAALDVLTRVNRHHRAKARIVAVSQDVMAALDPC